MLNQQNDDKVNSGQSFIRKYTESKGTIVQVRPLTSRRRRRVSNSSKLDLRKFHDQPVCC